MKTKEELEKSIKDTITEYKEIIFGPDTPICMVCFDELRRQQVIDKKVYDQKLRDDTLRELARNGLQKNMVMDGDMMIDRRTGEVLDPEVDFIVFVDHKITYRKAGELHNLNGTDTLDTFSLFFYDLFYLGLGLVPNFSLKFAIFFHVLQYFEKLNG